MMKKPNSRGMRGDIARHVRRAPQGHRARVTVRRFELTAAAPARLCRAGFDRSDGVCRERQRSFDVLRGVDFTKKSNWTKYVIKRAVIDVECSINSRNSAAPIGVALA
jgi:hypothetical protein